MTTSNSRTGAAQAWKWFTVTVGIAAVTIMLAIVVIALSINRIAEAESLLKEAQTAAASRLEKLQSTEQDLVEARESRTVLENEGRELRGLIEEQDAAIETVRETLRTTEAALSDATASRDALRAASIRPWGLPSQGKAVDFCDRDAPILTRLTLVINPSDQGDETLISRYQSELKIAAEEALGGAGWAIWTEADRTRNLTVLDLTFDLIRIKGYGVLCRADLVVRRPAMIPGGEKWAFVQVFDTKTVLRFDEGDGDSVQDRCLALVPQLIGRWNDEAASGAP
jgi:hypothetical protein